MASRRAGKTLCTSPTIPKSAIEKIGASGSLLIAMIVLEPFILEGTDAQATVSVKIEEKGKTTVGQAADTDTLVASANAYINALNKMIIKRDKTAPMEQESQKVRGI